jgi:hypothetical protein
MIIDMDAGMSKLCAPSILHPKYKKMHKSEEWHSHNG